MWPERGRSSLEIAIEHRVEPVQRRRLAVVLQRNPVDAELGSTSGEGRAEDLEHVEAGGDELRSERCNALAPRLDRLSTGHLGRRSPKRGVSPRYPCPAL